MRICIVIWKVTNAFLQHRPYHTSSDIFAKKLPCSKKKKEDWHNSLKLNFLFQWSFNKMKHVHMCLSNVSLHSKLPFCSSHETS